jgi:hypothetical protein
MSGTTSISRSLLILHHWRDNIFGLDGPMLEWFNAQRYTTIQDFGRLDDDDIADMEYSNSAGTTSKAPKSHRLRTKAAVGYFHYVEYYFNGDSTLDIVSANTINRSSFDRFYSMEFNPRKDIIRYSREYVLELELELNKAILANEDCAE